MAQATVKTEQIADGAITAAKIADGAIVAAELASNSVTTAKIADDAVTSAKLDTNIAIAGTLDVAGAVVFNEGSADVDFRVESNGNANMIFVDGGNDKVGIGVGAPDFALHVNSGATNTGILTESTDSGAYVAFKDNSTSSTSHVLLGAIADAMYFQAGNAERARISGNNLHLNGGTDARIQLGSGGAGANSTSNDTVHIRGDGDDMKLMAAADGNYIFEVNGSEKFRIASNGNIGVNISSPLDLLHLNDPDDDCVLNLDTAVANKNCVIKFSDPDAQGRGFIQYAHFDGTMRIHIEGLEHTRFTATGGLLVGTTTNQLYDTTSQSGFALHDTDSYSSCGAHLEIAQDSDAGWSPIYINKWDWNSGDDGRFMQMYIRGSGGTDSASIVYDGTNVALTNASDYRLKENIVDYTGGLAKINALQVRSFNKKEGASKDITQQGFIAHELAEHIPSAVIGEKDAMKVDETGETVPDYQQFSREALVPYLVSAIQELEARIKTLEDA